MPSRERTPVFLKCARHAHMNLKSVNEAHWSQHNRSFTTYLYFSLNSASGGKRASTELGKEKCDGAINSERFLSVSLTDKDAANKSKCAKDAAGSYNSKLISSAVISHMIDENKSEENGPAFPLRSVITEPNAYNIKQSLSNHSSVNINSAFRSFPSRLGIEAAPVGNVARTNLSRNESKQCQQLMKGFTSITITSRRMYLPSNQRAEVVACDQIRLRCSGSGTRESASGAFNNLEARARCNTAHCQKSFKHSLSAEVKVFSFHPPVLVGKTAWACTDGKTENMEVPLKSNFKKKEQCLFRSFVYHAVSQRCPNVIHYLDKSLSIPLFRPASKDQCIQRSVLSFNVNCCSTRSTADGVLGTPRKEPNANVPQPMAPEDRGKTDVIEMHSDKTQPPLKRSMERQHANDGRPPAVSESHPLTGFTNGKHSFIVQERTSQSRFNKQLKENSNEELHQLSDLPGQKGLWSLFGSSKKQDTYNPLTLVASGASVEESFPCRNRSSTVLHQSLESYFPPLKEETEECDALAENHAQVGILTTSGNISLWHYNKDKDDDQQNKSAKHLPAITLERQRECKPFHTSLGPVILKSRQLTLREALERHRPGFISHSRKRIRKLERKVQLRKAQSNESLASDGRQSSLLSSAFNKKKLYTVPDPLSDNLFKPKERTISEKEMQLRSKRIYNSLPEVKKKQEDKQKKVLLQSNRQRVDLFKKKLLNRILHRNVD
ncbi:(E2-independent) E3 ubiquitin-conjugating enzyme FATS [Lissotriton helveticus]